VDECKPLPATQRACHVSLFLAASSAARLDAMV